MKKIINYFLFRTISLIEKIQFRNTNLDEDNILNKIKNITFLDKYNIKIDSPEGWVNITEINETQPYNIFNVETEAGLQIYVADNHIFYDVNGYEKQLHQFKVGDKICTKEKLDTITKIENIGISNAMIDFSVDSDAMRYYSNDFISHNTITAAITLLHYCIFNTDKGVMIVANKGDTVIEILDKIKNIYKLLPFYLKPGIVNWNTKNIVFDNGCRIKSQARSKEPAIGFTIDFLYMDEFAHIPRNIINHYYKAIVPTVSSIAGSKIVITSTPNGANLFKELVMGSMLPDDHPDKNMYNLIKVLWHEVPDGQFILPDGSKINGTRLDSKLFFKHEQLKLNGFTQNMLLEKIKEFGFICKMDEQETDSGIKYFIKIFYEDGVTDIESLKKLRIDGIPLMQLFNITNWKEQETILIGGEENFNQEYNIQFIAGSKRVLSAGKSKDLDSRAKKFKYKEIKPILDLSFPVESIRFDPDFDIEDIHKTFWVTACDVSEGLSQDYSVINGARLMVKDEEFLLNNKIKSLHDAFYLRQTFIIEENILNNKTLFAELYYTVHFNFLNPERTKAVLELNGPGDGMLGALPGVFNSNNIFGKYIFAKFKQKETDIKLTRGYKVTRNKKQLVKQYIDSVENDSLYVLDESTIEQMSNFIKVDTPSGDVTYKSDSGNDDIVMTNIGFANYLLTQDYKNLCSVAYEELPLDKKILIDNALNENYENIIHSPTNKNTINRHRQNRNISNIKRISR